MTATQRSALFRRRHHASSVPRRRRRKIPLKRRVDPQVARAAAGRGGGPSDQRPEHVEGNEWLFLGRIFAARNNNRAENLPPCCRRKINPAPAAGKPRSGGQGRGHRPLRSFLRSPPEAPPPQKKRPMLSGRSFRLCGKSNYPRKESRIPAATADPTTPATLGPMACISR